MLTVGDRIPDVTVWLKPHEPHALADLAGGHALLVAWYLFDWSAT